MRKGVLFFIVAILALLANKAIAQNIFINQLGYFPSTEKYALIENPCSSSGAADIINVDTNSTAMKVNLSPAITDIFTKERVSKLDFSSLTIPGKYLIRYNGKDSFSFNISDTIYDNTLYQTSRSYYLQSCGIGINDTVSGMSHPPCHLQDGHIKRGDSFNPTDKLIDSKGGWHDAGDFGKYITSMSTSTTLLMSAFEMSPEVSGVKLDIPESSINMPDILDEIKYALTWMLKQQRPDGAVYRKTSGEKWPSDTTLPQDDTQKRFVYGISTQDTGRFAATMARASRIFKPYDQAFSSKCLKASQSAWNYINSHGYYVDYKNTDDSGSGGYPNPSYDTEPYAYSDLDEKIWAAAELYLATNDEVFLNYVKNNINKIPYEPFSWKNETFMSVILCGTKNISDKVFQNQMKQKILSEADKIVNYMNNNPYYIPMETFKWGSNANILGEGITLAYAYNITRDNKYKESALKTLNYIFGCNPMNKSYVSGEGSNPAQNIHYRYSMATGKVIPGFMAGGPNNTANDNTAIPGLKIKSYIDNAHSYATNECAIDYNAPLVFMLTWGIYANK